MNQEGATIDHLREQVKKIVISQISDITGKKITGDEAPVDLGIKYEHLLQKLESNNPKICLTYELSKKPVEKIADFWSKQAPGIIKKH